MWAAKDREKAGMIPSFWYARGCLLNEGSSNPTAEASLTDALPRPEQGGFWIYMRAPGGREWENENEHRASVQEELLALV